MLLPGILYVVSRRRKKNPNRPSECLICSMWSCGLFADLPQGANIRALHNIYGVLRWLVILMPTKVTFAGSILTECTYS